LILKNRKSKKLAEGNVTVTEITSDFGNIKIKEKLNEKGGYAFSEYYCIDHALKVMNSVEVRRKTSTDVLYSANNIDADKLYSTILKNNELSKNEKGKNKLNTFYSDATNEEIRKICNLLTKTINDTKDDRDITETASVLSRLKIFRHNTTSVLAGVSQNLVFYFNPNMISINKSILSISGRNNEEYDEKVLTFVHEIEHIKQWASSDDNNDNGMEAGFCRKYDSVPVNSLWDQWILEAAAEIKMTDYLNTSAMVYAKKINYANSYMISETFGDNEYEALINSTFENDLDGAFKVLNISSDEEKADFLNMMYSIQISQYDCNDFWDYYQKQMGKTLADDERTGLRMDIRTDIIYDLTKKYYNDLLTGIKHRNIRDAETVFYLMKVWELDCCTHMVYTNTDAYEHAREYIL